LHSNLVLFLPKRISVNVYSADAFVRVFGQPI
jgi:hypothetical protein